MASLSGFVNVILGELPPKHAEAVPLIVAVTAGRTITVTSLDTTGLPHVGVEVQTTNQVPAVSPAAVGV